MEIMLPTPRNPGFNIFQIAFQKVLRSHGPEQPTWLLGSTGITHPQ
nr:hypothetical protein Q903MT_gene2140 [Picea sitchensis]